MRKISALPAESIPRDADFKFKDRALVLLGKWQDIANAKGDKTAVDGEKPEKQADGDKAGGEKPDGDKVRSSRSRP